MDGGVDVGAFSQYRLSLFYGLTADVSDLQVFEKLAAVCAADVWRLRTHNIYKASRLELCFFFQPSPLTSALAILAWNWNAA